MKNLARRTFHKELRHLAGLYGIQPSYRDALGQRRTASAEAMLAVLRGLGSEIHQPADIGDAARAREQELGTPFAQPVYVIWGNARPRLNFHAPSAAADETVPAELRSETGETVPWPIPLASAKRVGSQELGGQTYLTLQVTFPEQLPVGYHRLTGLFQRRPFDALLIVAPRKAYPKGEVPRRWGVFAPLYALHSASSWGAGNYGDLNELVAWNASLGGSTVATLPLLPTFLDTPFDPSPYVPASRLFWNAFYIAPEITPEFHACAAARALVNGADFQATLAALRAAPQVDYRRQDGLQRRVMTLLAEQFFGTSMPAARRADYDRFRAANVNVEDYARFRAVMDLRQTSWPQWDGPLRDGDLPPSSFRPEDLRYHLYSQFVAHEQLGRAATAARDGGQGLYLDLPLGVHHDSYDVWRNRELFALDAAAGAPPDPFFTRGQNWGFPPLRPAPGRTAHYAYTIAFIRHHLQFAGVLRIDHVMALHRLFWIPRGMEATEGLYVHYPSEEMYAILTVESHRHRSWIVGENLGTVPEAVNRALRAHNIHRLYVLQYEVQPETEPLNRVPVDAVAGLNTHDMPMFEAYRRGADVDDRVDLKLLNEEGARDEAARRHAIVQAVTAYLSRIGEASVEAPASLVEATLVWLASSEARMMLVNLEDLWREEAPQNTPGTVHERANWRRKMKLRMEEIVADPGVKRVLDRVKEARTYVPGLTEQRPEGTKRE